MNLTKAAIHAEDTRRINEDADWMLDGPWKPYFGRIFFCTLKANSSAGQLLLDLELDGFNMQPNMLSTKPQNLNVSYIAGKW